MDRSERKREKLSVEVRKSFRPLSSYLHEHVKAPAHNATTVSKVFTNEMFCVAFIVFNIRMYL